MVKFSEILSKLSSKSRKRKVLLNQMQNQMRMQKIAEDRFKSSNERELERFHQENREEQIKEQLEYMRKRRQEEINFGHNPLNTKNIMKSEWEIMKEKNQFVGKSNMFSNQEFIHKNNPNLLKNNKRLIN